MNKKKTIIFYHYYFLIITQKSSSNLERRLFEKFAQDSEINLVIDEKYLFLYDEVAYSFDVKFEFLYSLYKSALTHFILDDEIENILKKYCIKTGFLNSNIKELSYFLIESIALEKPFDMIIEEIKL
ncbi:MAG: hypothetical protein K9I95_11360 [Flavobacteriaceae bacterium]|nr:hypothetical protein [Flavobacteriaceae bacterium]